MSLEEDYSQEIWEILQQIKQESNASTAIDYIQLRLPHDKKAKWATALDILEKRNVIKIEAKVTYDCVSIIDIDLFEEYYRKYELLCSNSSNLLKDCRQLIENILSESHPEHEYILAIVVKADYQGVIRQPNSLFPNFYGYTIDQTKSYLMTQLHITSNVPRNGMEMKIMTSENLVNCEHRLNLVYTTKSFNDLLNEQVTFSWAWTENITTYKNAELILVFRDKAIEFLKNYKQDRPEALSLLNKTQLLNPKIIISDLQSKYSEIQQEENQMQFFIKVVAYGKYIIENELTNVIVSPLFQEAEADARQYKQALISFVNDWKPYAEDILKKAKEANITDDNPMQGDINKIKIALEKGMYFIMWDSDVERHYTPYWNLMRRFKELDKEDLLIPKHFDSENGDLKLYPSYSKAKNEWDKYNYFREEKVWWAHYQICRIVTGVLEIELEKDYIKKNRILNGIYKFEFDSLSKGNDNFQFLIESKYRIWIKRLNDYLIPRLENYAEKDLNVSVKENKGISLEKEYKNMIQEIRSSGDDLGKIYQDQLKDINIKAPKIIEDRNKFNFKQTLKEFIKTHHIKGKEKKFLLAFSHKRSISNDELQKKTGSQNINSLKCMVLKKLQNTGWNIKLVTKARYNKKSFYELEYLTK